MTVERSRTDLLAPQMPELDTLRAVGALAVLTTHAGFWAGDYTRLGVRGTLLARLDVGVAIFFVLSGFLLSRPYLARAATGQGAPATGRYLWKRFLRIAPVYVLTVVVALVSSERTRPGPRRLAEHPLLTRQHVRAAALPAASPRCGAWRSRSPSTWCCPS